MQRNFDYYDQIKDAKRASTIYTERIIIRHWIEHLGHVRLDRITRALVWSTATSPASAG
jgi:hypothetical protein